jgi:transcriptional regulator with XRE-family HTH domain
MDEEAILHDLGKRIRAQRKSIGLTQEALALAANVDRSYYGAVERASAMSPSPFFAVCASPCNATWPN